MARVDKQINNIKEVVMEVDITGISSERQTIGIPMVYDMNGEVVDYSKVTMNTGSIKVNIPVLKTKSVIIVVDTVGVPATGYEVASVSYQPQSVIIAGTAMDLFSLGDTLHVECGIAGASSVVERNFDISALWAENLTSLRLVGEEELAVTVTMRELDEKVIEIEKEEIDVRNVPEGLKVEIINLTQDQIRVQGNQDKLKEITLQKLSPYIDMSGYQKGIYEVALYFDDLSGLLLQDMIKAEVRVWMDASAERNETNGDGTEAPEENRTE